MTNYDLMMEKALGEMNEAFAEWTEACGKLHRAKDSEARLAQANIAHQKFILAANACKQLYNDAIAEFRNELRLIRGE